MDYARFLTATALRRRPSPIRALQPLVSRPGMISLGGGMPNASLFPYTGITFDLADGTALKASPGDVKEALQYSPTPGLPELVKRLTAVQQAEHKPPRPVSLAVVPGSQDGLAKLFDALVAPGDSVLVEAPTYSGSLAFLEATGCKLVGVPTDGGGIRVDALAATLEGWDEARRVRARGRAAGTVCGCRRDARGESLTLVASFSLVPFLPQGRKPRLLYTISTGGNPTGASQPMGRKRELYDVARRHDLLLVEDDPYYYLQYAPCRTPSLLSLDVDGRVVRADSFSKILSAGLRVGTVTGPEPIVERVNLHNQASIMHTSGLSQLAVLLLLRHWRVGEGASGAGGGALGPAFEAHLARIRDFYAGQCSVLLDAAARHLVDAAGAPLAAFSRPSAGMFVWFKLLAGVDDTTPLIMTEAVEKKVRETAQTRWGHRGANRSGCASCAHPRAPLTLRPFSSSSFCPHACRCSWCRAPPSSRATRPRRTCGPRSPQRLRRSWRRRWPAWGSCCGRGRPVPGHLRTRSERSRVWGPTAITRHRSTRAHVHTHKGCCLCASTTYAGLLYTQLAPDPHKNR